MGYRNRGEIDRMIVFSVRLCLSSLQVTYRSLCLPARTIISEYVGLAHAFFSENEPAFINAILDGLAGQYRSDEFIDKKPFTS